MTVEDFTEQIQQMNKNLPPKFDFSPAHVYQKGSAENREIIGQVLDTLMLPGSGIKNKENLLKLYIQ